tara:strand:+ start:1105 stop:1548 length:444 start_codon:yes stop_codon:yes gene_type:complete
VTFQGVLVIDFILLLLIVAVVYLVARRQLYVGYAVIWIGVFLVAGLLVSVSPLLNALTFLLGAEFPVSALTLVALLFITLVLLYFSAQLSILGDQVTKLVQHIGISDLERRQTFSRDQNNVDHTHGPEQSETTRGDQAALTHGADED